MHDELDVPITRDDAATSPRSGANDVPDAGEGHKGPRTDVERSTPGTIDPGGRANVAPRVPSRDTPAKPGGPARSERAIGE